MRAESDARLVFGPLDRCGARGIGGRRSLCDSGLKPLHIARCVGLVETGLIAMVKGLIKNLRVGVLIALLFDVFVPGGEECAQLFDKCPFLCRRELSGIQTDSAAGIGNLKQGFPMQEVEQTEYPGDQQADNRVDPGSQR